MREERRRPDYERRAFEPRRRERSEVGCPQRRIGERDRRKAQNGSQARRACDRTDCANEAPEALTLDKLQEVIRSTQEGLKKPLFRFGEIVSMNQLNMDRLGSVMHDAYPYNRFELAPLLPDNIIAIQRPWEFPGLRLIILTGKDDS